MTKMNTKKKIISTVAALSILGAAGIGGTLAYLTDSEQHVNTFTVGDVKIDLEEVGYSALTVAEKTNIVPNQELVKDPLIKNTGVNDAIVFLKVTVPTVYVTPVADDGTVGTKASNEIFFLKDTADTQATHANNFDSMWIELNGNGSDIASKETTVAATQGTDGYRTYVFGYKTALTGSADGHPSSVTTGDVTNTLFEKIQLRNVIEDEITQGKVQEIKVEAYAIQANDIILDNQDSALITSGNLTQAQLTEIYDIFVTQGTKTNPKEAATGNKKNLADSDPAAFSADPLTDTSANTESGD